MTLYFYSTLNVTQTLTFGYIHWPQSEGPNIEVCVFTDRDSSGNVIFNEALTFVCVSTVILIRIL